MVDGNWIIKIIVIGFIILAIYLLYPVLKEATGVSIFGVMVNLERMPRNFIPRWRGWGF